jgi:hypothetical protein
VHREGQGERSVRVRGQSTAEHQAANSYCTPERCREIPTTVIRYGPLSRILRGSQAVRSNACMSTNDTATTMPQTRTMSSSQDKSVACSVASNASSDVAPPSRR